MRSILASGLGEIDVVQLRTGAITIFAHEGLLCFKNGSVMCEMGSTNLHVLCLTSARNGRSSDAQYDFIFCRLSSQVPAVYEYNDYTQSAT